jgi:hypothetical protein
LCGYSVLTRFGAGSPEMDDMVQETEEQCDKLDIR